MVRRAQQELDPFCSFVFKVKRGEVKEEGQEEVLQTLPKKVAAALKYYMETKAKSRTFEEFEIRRGKLYRKDVDALGYPRLCLVVPWRLRARVLTANHDAPTAAHGGLYKTYELLRRWYWWFGMHKDAKAWVKSCHCQQGKRRTIAGHGTAKHMGLVPTKYRPWERVVVDLIGPLPESHDGMNHVLVVVDAFSSETKLEPLRTRNSEDIANLLLKRVVLGESCPKSWQTDNAPELVSAAVAKLADIAGITPKHASAYEAHTQGRVEKRNWSVGMSLREMTRDDQRGWPAMLPWVEYANNSSVYSVTGMTPYFHKTGYDSISPSNAWREVGEESGEPVKQWSDRMRKAMVFAEMAHADAAKARKEAYDKDKKEHGIVDGDQVYVWIPRGNKLDMATMGPMVVKRFLDAETKRTAVLHPPGLPEETMTAHVDRLVKAHERPLHLTVIPSDLSDWIKEQPQAVQPAAQVPAQEERASQVEEPARGIQIPQHEIQGEPQVTKKQRSAELVARGEWKVERIVGHKDMEIKEKGKKKRKKGNQEPLQIRHYRVRFEGFGEKDDLWYSDDDLRGEGLLEMMEAYDQEQLLKEEERRQQLPSLPGDGVKRSARLAARVLGK